MYGFSNTTSTWPYSKLDYQRFGPYMITGKISDVAFLLDLPPHMHLHPVFHVSRLEPYTTSSIPSHLTKPPPTCRVLGRTRLFPPMIELGHLMQIFPMLWNSSLHFILTSLRTCIFIRCFMYPFWNHAKRVVLLGWLGRLYTQWLNLGTWNKSCQCRGHGHHNSSPISSQTRS